MNEHLTIIFTCDDKAGQSDLIVALQKRYPLHIQADEGTRILGWSNCDVLKCDDALRDILEQETDYPNATVSRIMAIARTALGFNSNTRPEID